jgi:hypothetical protein
MKIQTLTRKEKNTVPLPIMPVNGLDKYFLPNPMIRKPINGKKGTNQAICNACCIKYLQIILSLLSPF